MYNSEGPLEASVPDGLVWVVRDIDAYNRGGLGAVLDIEFPSGALIFSAVATTLNPGPWFPWRGRQILTSGETMVIGGASGPWDCTVSGYQLTSS
jgi:hypothetical protein